MEHNFIFNSYSFPAATKGAAFSFLLETSRGVLAMGAKDDRYAILYDGKEKLQESPLAPGYLYKDFLAQLGTEKEEDLQLFLHEMADKSPALDYVTAEKFEEIAECCFYFADDKYEKSLDILAIAWVLDATLFSISTSTRWAGAEVEFDQYNPEDHAQKKYFLRNVSKETHGKSIKANYLKTLVPPLPDAFPHCKFTPEFIKWFDDLDEPNRLKIRNKLSCAEASRFEGGMPFIKALKGTDEKIVELRFSAVSGEGAIRILFARLSKDLWAILTGFIKIEDNDGYSTAIPEAERLLRKLSQDG